MPRALVDLCGQRFGRLVVVKRAADKMRQNGKKDVRWVALCDCGKTTEADGSNIKRGQTKSCGCIGIVHGQTNSEHYFVWKAMIARCHNKSNHNYSLYGGRGIKVCETWLHSVQSFIDDTGPRPSPKHQLDRIDNDGDYTPNNCRWSTPSEQARNKRSTRKFTFQAKTLCIKDWAEFVGVSQSTIESRFLRGVQPEDAIFKPVSKQHSAASMSRRQRQATKEQP